MDIDKSLKVTHWFLFLRNVLSQKIYIQTFELNDCCITKLVDKN